MGKVLYVWPNGCSTQSCVKWNVLYYRHSTWACLDLISSSAVIPALASRWSSTPLPPVWVGSRQTWPVLISQYISYLTSHFYFILFHLLFFTLTISLLFFLTLFRLMTNGIMYPYILCFRYVLGEIGRKDLAQMVRLKIPLKWSFINLWIRLNGTPILGSGKQSPARTLRRNARSVEYLQWTKVSFSRL